jgi:hypothetical protein
MEVRMNRFLLSAGLASALAAGRAAAAFEELPAHAALAGMGSAAAVPEGVASIWCNPAAPAGIGVLSITAASARPYGFAELETASVAAAFPCQIGHAGIACSTYGRSPYRETELGIGLAAHSDKRVCAGFLLRRLWLSVDRYGAWNGWALDLGMAVRLGTAWTLGFSAANLNQERLDGPGQPLPQVTRLGLRYSPGKDWRIFLELDQDVRWPVETRGGFEWRPLAFLRVRSGFGRNPFRFSGGMGVTVRGLSFDYACTVHPVLGQTHHAAVTVSVSRDQGRGSVPEGFGP